MVSRPADGGAEHIKLLPIQQIPVALRQGQFTLVHSCIILDCFIRPGSPDFGE